MVLNLIDNHLSYRKKRVKVSGAYTSWRELLFGISQGSILGPWLFNSFLCDLFYFLEGKDLASYVDVTIPLSVNLTQKLVINKLKESSSIFSKWFYNNFMKVNSDKSHFLIANIDNNCIESEDVHELLVITTDSKLMFKTILINFAKRQVKS